MHNIKVVSTFAILALSSLASATCNWTGYAASAETMNSMKDDSILEVVCSSLVGNYAGKEARDTCIEIGGGKYDFTLKYKNSGYRTMGLDECKDGMKKELKCVQGGKSGYGNWWYRADYNKGHCTQPFRRSVEQEAEPVGSADEPEAAQDIRRSHSRAFKA